MFYLFDTLRCFWWQLQVISAEIEYEDLFDMRYQLLVKFNSVVNGINEYMLDYFVRNMD